MNAHGVGGDAPTVTLSPDELEQAKRLLHRLVGGEERSPTNLETQLPPSRNQLLKIAQLSQFVRDTRHDFFSRSMFGEPAWDLLLALYVEAGLGKRPTVSNLAKAADTPVTTAMRWIDYLEEKGLVTRQRSDQDRRMSVVALAEQGRASLDAYFTQVVEQFPTR